MYKPGETFYFEFITSNPSTGQVADATGTPVATSNVDGTDDPLFVLTVTRLDLGRYLIEGTVPSTYTYGTVVNITVSATVSAIPVKLGVASFSVPELNTQIWY